MTCVAFAFAAGAALLQLQAALPPLAWAWLVVPLAAGALRFRALWIPAALAAGFFWAAACAQSRMSERLPAELEGRDLPVVGVVAGLPALGERSVRFELEVESGEPRLPKKLLLSWYGEAPQKGASVALPALHPGERWSLTLRLHRPHGLANPHGFDYEAWLLERGIGATGYVRAEHAVLLGHRGNIFDSIEKTREAIRDRFLAVLGPSPAEGILAALAVGDQRAISREEWQLEAQRTQTTNEGRAHHGASAVLFG